MLMNFLGNYTSNFALKNISFEINIMIRSQCFYIFYYQSNDSTQLEQSLLIFKKLSTLFPTIFYHINYMPLEDRYLVMNS